jgi:cytochrome bd-type quinol oxidase subunit 2
MPPSEEPTFKKQKAHPRWVEITAHVLAVVYTASGVVVQSFVPRFAEMFRDLGEISQLPALTAAILHWHWALMAVAIVSPLATVVVAWRSRCRLPLPLVSAVMLVLTTILSVGTAIALLGPMGDIIKASGDQPSPVTHESGR